MSRRTREGSWRKYTSVMLDPQLTHLKQNPWMLTNYLELHLSNPNYVWFLFLVDWHFPEKRKLVFIMSQCCRQSSTTLTQRCSRNEGWITRNCTTYILPPTPLFGKEANSRLFCNVSQAAPHKHHLQDNMAQVFANEKEIFCNISLTLWNLPMVFKCS